MDAIIFVSNKNDGMHVDAYLVELAALFDITSKDMIAKTNAIMFHAAMQGEQISGATCIATDFSGYCAATKVSVLLRRGSVPVAWEDIDAFMSMCERLNVTAHGGAFIFDRKKEVTGRYFYLT